MATNHASALNTQQAKSSGEEKPPVQISIDGRRLTSPERTTAQDLYSAGNVATGLSLYRIRDDDHEDELVKNGSQAVHLAEGEQFRTAEASKQGVTVVVNARPQRVTSKRLTFEQVVALAFPTSPGGVDLIHTVTYYRGHGDKPEGTLVTGGSVKVKEGMVFNVTATNRS